MAPKPNLSLVIPLYNEEQRFGLLRQALAEFRQGAGGLGCEIILVNDGSGDDTSGLMERFKAEGQAVQGPGGGAWQVRLISLPRNQGKGNALRAGVMAAQGDWVLTLDADMACPPSQLLQWQEQGFMNLRQAPDPSHVFYGCREHAASQVNDDTYRRLMGKVFNTLVQLTTDLPLEDTQCGFKLYPRQTAQRCFELVANWGWAHDVEITKVLGELGCSVQALPIAWTAIAGSKIKPLSDAVRMFLELFKIESRFILRWRLGLGRRGEGLAGGVLYNRLSLLLGLVLLMLVFGTYMDYGLTSDERVQAEYGELVVRYYTSGFSDKSSLNLSNLYLYGGLFEAGADLFSKLTPIEYYRARHLFTALVGLLGLAGAWRLAGYLGGPRAAFWAAAFLAATPSYYGHIFNNSKDIPFAAAYMWAVYYLVRALVHLPRVPKGLAIKLGLALGVCLGIKVGGIMVGLYMVLLGLLWLVPQLPGHRLGEVLRGLYVMVKCWYLPVAAIAYAIMLLSWPWAQKSPIYYPYFALRVFARFGHNHLQLFDGLYYCSLSMPPAYVPVYLLYKLPEALIVVLLCGGGLLLWQVFTPRRKDPKAAGGWLQFAGLAVAAALPPALVMFSRATIYDGLRHLIFIIPPLAVLGGLAWEGLLRRLEGPHRKAAGAAGLCLALVLAHQASIMARLHPYEYAYFNAFIGGLAGAQGKYELDYWGATYAEALVKLGEIIRKEEARTPGPRPETYRVFCRGTNSELAVYLGSAIPSNLQRTGDPLQADFHVDFTRWEFHKATNGTTIATVERLGVPLNYIKDLRQVGRKTYVGRKRLCERDFQPTAQIPLD